MYTYWDVFNSEVALLDTFFGVKDGHQVLGFSAFQGLLEALKGTGFESPGAHASQVLLSGLLLGFVCLELFVLCRRKSGRNVLKECRLAVGWSCRRLDKAMGAEGFHRSQKKNKRKSE